MAGARAKTLRIIGAAARRAGAVTLFGGTLALGLLTAQPALAQESGQSDQTQAGDAPARAAFERDFGGLWEVYLGPRGDHAASWGTAEVTPDGVLLTLQGANEDRQFRSFEVELQDLEYRDGESSAPDTRQPSARKQATIHLKRLGDAEAADFPAAAAPLILPKSAARASFELEASAGESAAAWPVEWQDGKGQLRLSLGFDETRSRAAGGWDRSDEEKASGSGTAAWRRAAPVIRDVIVVDNQLAQPYPFDFEGADAGENVIKTRRLIVQGDNLGRIAEAGVPLGSDDASIGYAFDPNGLRDDDPGLILVRAVTRGALANAMAQQRPDPRLVARLQERLAALQELDRLHLVEASLKPGVTPGFKRLSLGRTRGRWPLIFADQGAALRFARHDDQAREDSAAVFYPGDIGAVDIVFETDLPVESLGVRLMRRPAGDPGDGSAEPDRIGHVLLAKRLDELQAQGKAVFRTEPIHFLSASAPELAPPPDPEAYVMQVENGDVIGARLLDPAEAAARPGLVTARIAAATEDLGELWKSALRRVAICEGESFDGDPLYALETSTRFSEIAVGELVRYISPIAFIAAELSDAEKSDLDFNPSVDVYKGDHAAAILIRDELVKLMADPKIVGPITALANNDNGEIQALRARALLNGPESEPLVRFGSAVWKRKPFWQQPTIGKALNALFGSGGPASKDGGGLVKVELAETLDIKTLAARFDVTETEAEAWAIEATRGAAKRQLTNLEKAIGRAADAGDCNLEELLVVAGQKSDAAVERIVPRLLKRVTLPGPPQRSHWQPDKLARGYVERLHMAGAAVRALDQYGAIDDAYKAMAVAVATAGAAAAATAVLSGGAAVGAGLLIAGDAADAAYFGVKGLERAIQSEAFYDYAQGASLVLGDEILIEAESQRESVGMAMIGLLAPGLSAGVGVKDLRHFKNIDDGKALLKAKGVGVLDELDGLTDAERTQLAAYYADLADKTSRSGLSGLDDSDRTAIEAFGELERRQSATAPPPGASDAETIATKAPTPGSAADPFATRPPDLPPEADPRGPYIGVDERLGPDFQNALSDEAAVPLRPLSADGQYFVKPRGGESVGFDQKPLGQGSFNTAFQVDEETVLRVPGGLSGRPSRESVLADKGGREVFEKAGIDKGKVRLVEQKGPPIRLEDSMEIPVSGQSHGRDMSDIRLTPEDEIEVVEYFKHGSLKDRMTARGTRSMTAEEAIAYDKGVRELNGKGLVALDLKYDNFGFEPVRDGADELRLVILDPGGIVPVKGGDPAIARRTQATIDGTDNARGPLGNLPKKVRVIRAHGDSLDVNAVGLDDPFDVPFNPAGVSDYEKGRNLSSMTPAEAAAYYEALRAAEQP